MSAKIAQLPVETEIADLQFQCSSARTRELAPLFNRILKEDLVSKFGFCIHSDPATRQAALLTDEEEPLVDLVQTRNNPPQFGFCFSVTKFAQGYRVEVGRGEFRYRHDEVVEAIRRFLLAIEPAPTNPRICYERGYGVFVYNVFI